MNKFPNIKCPKTGSAQVFKQLCQIKPKLIQFNKLAASIRPIPTKRFYLFSGVIWPGVLAFPPSTLLSAAPK
ncbi:TPA: hypothetical protein ACF2P8_002972, partial [Legionella pneumophila]